MTTIKMDKEALTTAITNFENKVTIYKDSTVSSIAQFSSFQDVLTGKAYTSLVNSINTTLDTQKQLVAECIVLTDNAKNFAEDISSEESSVSFG
ncbi:hypothetical protein [Streptococcus pantholopis]|uniref:Type VII secretion protein n=1 Tax=Streptococcus pantholopis TaxID=1811193 RepID=A0A172Q934_9STRE|nr:hypothetical protein [Streptococcus pantholopis]AND80013.1 hypothetical protein A0O21_08360 [Streptococcus pantholopis]